MCWVKEWVSTSVSMLGKGVSQLWSKKPKMRKAGSHWWQGSTKKPQGSHAQSFDWQMCWNCWNWQVVHSRTLLIDVLRTTYCLQNDYITCAPSHICYDWERGSFPYCFTSSLVCLVCSRLPCTVPTQCLKYDTRQVQHPFLVCVLPFVLLTTI